MITKFSIHTINLLLALLLLFINCQKDDYYNLGVFHAREGNHEKAIFYFTKVIKESPLDHEAYYNRAYSQQLLGGKENNVIQDYSKSLELNPNDSEAYMFRGFAYQKIGQLEKAIDDYIKSIEIEPNNSITYFNLGNAFMQQNNLKEACLIWQKASSLGNVNADIALTSYCQE